MVGGMYCCVYGCDNKQKHNKQSFFSLPSDPKKLAVWLSLIQREDILETFKTGKLNHRVCSDHFGEKDMKYTKKLYPNAIPNLKLPPSTQKDQETCPSTSKHDSILHLQNSSTETLICETNSSGATNFSEQCTSKTSTLLSTKTQRKRKLEMQLTVASKEIKLLEKKEYKKVTEEAMSRDTFLKLCEKFLDKKSLKIVKCYILLPDNLKDGYTMDFKLFALHIYMCSPYVYRLLEQFLHFPSISTLQTIQISISSSINKHFFNVLKQKTLQMGDKEKVCTLCIGALSLKSRLSYHANIDKIHGLHEIDNVVTSSLAKYAVVVMARGIFAKWKQPIGYALTAECRNYPELLSWLDNIIRALLEVGLDVRAIVSDLKSDVSSTLEARNITTEKTWFEIDGKKIYYIFDAPSLFKCARDHLINYNFYYGDKIAKWQHIEQAYEEDNIYNLKLMYKVTEKHINPNYFDRKQVHFATQIFSRTVALAMNAYVVAKLIDEEAKDTVELILFFNNLFDTLNSASVFNEYTYKRAYQGKQDQKEFLLEALQLLKSLYLKRLKQPLNNITFINGFIITIKSIMCLFDDLKKEGHGFLLTRNLNQNCLNNLFVQIRQQACDYKPMAVQFYRAFKKYLLEDILKPTNGNNEDDLNAILSKVSDYFSKSNGTIEKESEDFPQFKLNIGTADYKFDLPKKNALTYVTGFLILKCIAKHWCRKLMDYFNKQQDTPILYRETLLKRYKEYNKKNSLKLNEGLITPPESFIDFVETLDRSFKDYFIINRNDLSRNIGNNLLAAMAQESFDMPCPCFPLEYLKKLYIRLRIFSVVTDNNNNLKKKQDSYTSIRISDL